MESSVTSIKQRELLSYERLPAYPVTPGPLQHLFWGAIGTADNGHISHFTLIADNDIDPLHLPFPFLYCLLNLQRLMHLNQAPFACTPNFYISFLP